LKKLPWVVLICCLLTGTSLTQASWAATGELAVSSIPREFVVGDPTAKKNEISLEIFVTSDLPKLVQVEFVDFFSGEGGRSQLPSGSTPYSLANVLEIAPFDNRHPGGGQKRYLVTIKPKVDYEQQLFTGGVVVRLDPVGSQGGGVGSTSSILRAMTVTPYGLVASLDEGNLQPAQVIRHDIHRLERSSFIDSLLPDLPGIVNFGPVESRVTYTNPGEYPVFSKLSWAFEYDGEVIASKSLREALLSPGQEVQKAVTTQVSGQVEGSQLNLLPGFGFVSNKITLNSSLGGTELPVQVYDGSFLVLQWKEPFVGIVGLYFLVRWAWRKNLSPRQRQETATLIGLGIQSAWKGFKRRLRGASGNAPEPIEPIAAPSPKAINVKPSEPRPVEPRPMYIPPSASYKPPHYPIRKP
jgi:hypothetical protein